MSAQHTLSQLYTDAVQMIDPGNAGTLTVDRQLAYCGFVSAAAETRTLARPTAVGQILMLAMKTDGGDITLTVTGGYNLAVQTVYTFTDAGQEAIFVSELVGSSYVWRLISSVGGGGGAGSAEVVITTRTVRADESGKTFYLDLAAGFVTTLPAVALGLSYCFVIRTAVTGNMTIVCPAAAALFKGHVLTTDVNSATDPDFDTTAVATLTFVANKSVAGDRIWLDSDGTNWFYTAETSVFDAITGT